MHTYIYTYTYIYIYHLVGKESICSERGPGLIAGMEDTLEKA